MSIDLKNKALTAAYLGSKSIKKIYKGEVLLFPKESQSVNYTYQYSGNNYVTAKCYYKDANGNLFEQVIPSTGGNACLVLDYSVGVNRYLNGVFVDEVALTYGATLEALNYMTFAGDECEWWEETASPLSDWTHNIQYSLGESIVRGASAVDMSFGEAPVPFVTKDNFVAVQFSGIKLKLPAGILEGLGELTLECSDVASLYQEYRSYGNVSKVTYQIRNLTYGFDGINPGGTIDISNKNDTDNINLEISFDMKCISEFDSGHVEENNWYDTCGIAKLDLYDYGEFASVGTLEINSRIENISKILREWNIYTFKNQYLNVGNVIDTNLGITFDNFGYLAKKYSCEEFVDIDSTITEVSSSKNLIYPFGINSWHFNM